MNSFCLFVGSKYCVPVTLLNPINNIIGHITFIIVDTFSYPFPKKNGTNASETEISPIINGNANKNTRLNEFFIYCFTFLLLPSANVEAILGNITVPKDVIKESNILTIF